MIIREAKESDLAQMLPFLMICFKEMEFSKYGYTFDIATVSKLIKSGIASGDTQILVAKKDAKLLGVMMVTLIPTPMNYKEKMAGERIWHSLPSLNVITRGRVMIGLFASMREWIKQKQIKSFKISTSCNIASVTNFLKNNGFVNYQNEYIKPMEVV